MPQVSLPEFVKHVRTGKELVSFPTDTVPALAAHPEQGKRIYGVKNRPADKPLILMGACLSDLLPYVVGIQAEITQWQQIAERYWPGALTLVLPASDLVPAAMNPMKTGTLGIRVPDHPLARYLLSKTGPLATTSVNRSGEPPLLDTADISAQFPELLMLSDAAIATIKIEIGNFTLQASGVPSTVIRWQGHGWEVLRQGSVEVLP